MFTRSPCTRTACLWLCLYASYQSAGRPGCLPLPADGITGESVYLYVCLTVFLGQVGLLAWTTASSRTAEMHELTRVTDHALEI